LNDGFSIPKPSEVLDSSEIKLLKTSKRTFCAARISILNKKINLIRESKKELANLFMSFDSTIGKAQVSIENLKQASNEASNDLQKHIDSANLLVEDLRFLHEKSIKISNQIDKKMLANKNDNKVIERPSVDVSPETIRKMKQQANKDKLNNKTSNNGEKNRVKALEGLLEKIADNKTSSPNNNGNSDTKIKEQEITRALKAMGYGE
jgi:hypothetical protein